MRRLDPGTSVALPPISSVEVHTDGAGWTVTERRQGRSLRKPSSSPRITGRRSSEAEDAAALSPARRGRGGGAATASPAASPERDPLRATMPAMGSRDHSAPPASLLDTTAPFSPGQPGAPVKQPNLLKGRAIENWLNRTLCQAGKPHSAVVSNSAAKQMQGLAQFGVDAAALEKLGLDAQMADRVYRAMFVYSQGLHAVLQEAVGRAKSSSAALLVLWRAFTAVMEHAGQSEEQGDSLAALVQRGNEEEKARIESKYKDQLSIMHGQLQKLNTQRRALQEEVARLREDESRLRGESEMYKAELETNIAKHDKEITLRARAEVNYLDKTREAESLQTQLDKERREAGVLRQQLKAEVTAKELAQVELESMRTQVKVLETQVTTYKQGIAEAAQQKQRHEQQVGMLKQQLDRHDRKMQEVRDQLEQEAESNKRLNDTNANQTRELRRLERQCEDESHLRRELTNERDSLRDKLDRMDKDLQEVTEDRRALQKKFNDQSMNFRTNQIDLKRKTENCERAEMALERLQKHHKELLEKHREVSNEIDGLRSDVDHLEKQLANETELRKNLQFEKKQLNNSFQTQTAQMDTLKLNLQNTQREFTEMTDAKVKLDSVVRDQKSAMQKAASEHHVELKAAIQKVAMLEKVIADERNERRSLVSETHDVAAKREEMYDTLKKKEFEIRDLRRQRLEREEEVDRFKTLLRAQEQRNADQLVIVDKYHAAVANHNAETREMQVLLESERAQMKKQLQELQDTYSNERAILEQRIERWKFSYEDVLSQLNFNPLTEKIHGLECNIDDLQSEVRQLTGEIKAEKEKTKTSEQRLLDKAKELRKAKAQIEKTEEERDRWIRRYEVTLLDFERESLARGDAEHMCERIKKNTEAFDEMKADLERQIDEQKEIVAELRRLMTKPMADAETQVFVYTSLGQVQTDLSYQYLESSVRLNEDVGRRERLDALKSASHFVEDAEAHRDFQAYLRTAGSLPVAQVQMRFEEAKGAARLHVAAPRPGVASGPDGARAGGGGVAGGYGGAPEPYPTRPPGQRPPQVRGAGAPRPTPARGAGAANLAAATVTRRLDTS